MGIVACNRCGIAVGPSRSYTVNVNQSNLPDILGHRYSLCWKCTEKLLEFLNQKEVQNGES